MARPATKRKAPAKKLAARSAPNRKTVARTATKPAAPAVMPDAPAELAGLVSRQFARNLASAMQPHGVAPAQFQILQLLWIEDGLSQRALADRARIEPPTLVRTLDRMERDGQVKRRKDKQDKRQTNIFLTAKGRKLQDTLRRIVADTEKRALSGVTKADQKAVAAALQKMANNLSG